jgi:hypothetical protein
MIKTIAQTGVGCSGTSYDIYLSSVNIDSSSSYTMYDDWEVSRFYAYAHEPIITQNHQICSMHKKWIKSLKKYATFISQSNEILQAKFFEKQLLEVEKLKK